MLTRAKVLPKKMTQWTIAQVSKYEGIVEKISRRNSVVCRYSFYLKTWNRVACTVSQVIRLIFLPVPDSSKCWWPPKTTSVPSPAYYAFNHEKYIYISHYTWELHQSIIQVNYFKSTSSSSTGLLTNYSGFVHLEDGFLRCPQQHDNCHTQVQLHFLTSSKIELKQCSSLWACFISAAGCRASARRL